MPKLKVAHIREQGQDMILVPLDSTFESQSETVRFQAVEEIQRAATSAGLRGQVAVIWRRSGGHGFIGPQPWHPFLRSITVDTVQININKQISW